MNKCLYCYQPLKINEKDFHEACSKKMFGNTTPPIINLDLKKIEELAKQLIVNRIAITGVQPKLSLNLEKNKSEIPRLTIVGIHGDYILKPPTSDYEELPQNEDVTMHLAKIAKIRTAQHTLIRLQSGELAYLTKRFDRNKEGKIAVEDFCQLTENLTENKYRSSVEKIGKLIHKHTENKGFEAQKLFELVLFCFLSGNADMHLKNFSLMENNIGSYELSPAYDLLNTALVIKNDNEEFALTINGKKNKLNLNDFNYLAQSLKINPKSVEAIYRKFISVKPKWNTFLKQSFLSENQQKEYMQIIENKFNNLF